MSRFGHVIVAVAFSALLAQSVFGQGTTLGSIVGTVMDPSGAAVPGARARVLNTQTGVARETETDGSRAVSPRLGNGTAEMPERALITRVRRRQ